MAAYSIDCIENRFTAHSNATASFLIHDGLPYLLTNWHVVTGLDPALKQVGSRGVPIKFEVQFHLLSGGLKSETIYLYDEQGIPLWLEHQDRAEVDLVLVPIPRARLTDVHINDIRNIKQAAFGPLLVGDDIFILGYPFQEAELTKQFAGVQNHVLPIWKRGTVASEPELLFNERVLLIDTLGRGGMSGAPIFRYVDTVEIVLNDAARVAYAAADGKPGLAFICALENDFHKNTVRIRSYSLVGIYSGVVGLSRGAEVALGKCWVTKLINELLANPVKGEMLAFAPTQVRLKL